MRRPIIAGNWKMNKTILEAIELVNGLKRQLYDINNMDIVVCPPFTALCDVNEVIMETNITLGAQDLFWEENGAFTGEISAKMLKDVGCQYVIIGHSERRQYFGETNETVNKKLKIALKTDLLPIVCVGEKLEEKDKGLTFDVIKDHIENGLAGLSSDDILKVIIAYEPVWAIGTGRNATPQQAQEAHSYIRKLLTNLFDKETAGTVRIQYGGSIKPENIKDIMKQPDVDGGLVGGASLDLASFVQIVKLSCEAKNI